MQISRQQRFVNVAAQILRQAQRFVKLEGRFRVDAKVVKRVLRLLSHNCYGVMLQPWLSSAFRCLFLRFQGNGNGLVAGLLKEGQISEPGQGGRRQTISCLTDKLNVAAGPAEGYTEQNS